MAENIFHDTEIEHMVQQIDAFCARTGSSVEAAIAYFRNMPNIYKAELLQAAQMRIDEIANGIILDKSTTVIMGAGLAKPWYIGPQEGDRYWPALKSHLRLKGWDDGSLAALDRSSTKVLASIGGPGAVEVKTRGLVLGHVQSGKTTNFTAVISKAADKGYRLFIVLSGVSNSLRKQTQIRLTEQLVDLNNRPQQHFWFSLTSENGDLGPPQNAFLACLAHPAFRTLVVVKKNPRRLENLLKFLQAAKDAGHLDTCPILVIDDEADQASLSPNVKPDEQTKINGLIVEILTKHDRTAYVAYTATPFANFFVDPKYDENLYPRDFIIPLPEPRNYIGSRKMFGESDEQPPEFDVVRRLADAELPDLVPPRGPAANRFRPKMTESLRSGLRWFLLATTVRRLLADGSQPHSTMMIHTSERVAQHERMWQCVSDELLRMKCALEARDQSERAAFRDLWELECIRVDPQPYGYSYPPTAEVIDHLESTIGDLGDLANREAPDCALVIDNGTSARRLIYDNSIPKPVIVIGGNTLSRGLTLEGLVCSVFVRSVGLYDTLLQMGRWFGYRPGYESLPRVWMPEIGAKRFRDLARVEMEIRGEIDRYAARNVTPLDVAVRIRTHPAMQITRAQMMRNVRRIRVSYSGAEVDTAYLFNDSGWLNRNIKATKRLASEITLVRKCEKRGENFLFRLVPAKLILDFFESENGYQVQPSAGGRFESKGLRQHIEIAVARGELLEWNVAFMSGSEASPRRLVNLCDDMTIATRFRGRDKSRSRGDVVSIGDHLPGDSDKVIDLPPDPENRLPKIRRDDDPRTPLLLIYLIDKDSQPARHGGRAPLNIKEHFVGVAVCLPTSDGVEERDFIEVILPEEPVDGHDDEDGVDGIEPVSADDDSEGDAEPDLPGAHP